MLKSLTFVRHFALGEINKKTGPIFTKTYFYNKTECFVKIQTIFNVMNVFYI